MNTVIILFLLYYVTCLSIRWYAALKQRQLISNGKAIIYTENKLEFGDSSRGYFVKVYRVKNGWRNIQDTPFVLFLQGFIWFYDITLLICSKLYHAICAFVNGFNFSSVKQ